MVLVKKKHGGEGKSKQLAAGVETDEAVSSTFTAPTTVPKKPASSSGDKGNQFMDFLRSFNSSVFKKSTYQDTEWLKKYMKRRMLHPTLGQFKGVQDKVSFHPVPLRKESMNSGDAFVLDLGDLLYVWCGRDCNEYERDKAISYVKEVTNHRGPNTHFSVLKQGVNDDNPNFWRNLQTQAGCLPWNVLHQGIMSEEQGGDDSKVKVFHRKLYPLNVKSGRLTRGDPWRSKDGSIFARKKLDSKKCFLLDDGFTLWIWVGKLAMKESAAYTVLNLHEQAIKYLSEKEHHLIYKRSHDRPPMAFPIIHENREPEEFKKLFLSIRRWNR